MTENTLAWYNDQGKVKLTGWVSDPPDVRESGVYVRMTMSELETLNVQDGNAKDVRISGDALVMLPAWASYKLGDQLQFLADPRTPFTSVDFSYRDYLSRQGIYSVVYYPQSVKLVGSHPVNPIRLWLENQRQFARSTIFELFPQPESGLLAGILLGLDNDLPASLAQAYRDTGTAHIIAISGFNMAILAGLLMALCSKAFNRYGAFILTAVGLSLYTVLVGGSPSVVRAAVMAVVAMGGHLIGRRSTGTNALCFTAALMCMFNPLLLWDTSFQLSFAATLGLVLFGSPLQTWAEESIGRRVPEEQVQRYAGPLSEYFLLTMAAQVATLPVIALQFKRLSISSLLTNPLVLPVQPAVLVAGGVTTLAGMVAAPLGKLGAVVAWPLLAYTNRIVAWIARVAPGSVSIDSRLALGIALLILAGFLLFLFRTPLKKMLGKLSFAWISLGLLAIILSVWTAFLQRPDGNLHLEWIRAGDAVNLVVASPEGHKIAINPQGSIDELTSTISQSLSLWQHSLDAVLITDRKAVSSLANFNESLPIRQVLLAPSLTHPLTDETPIRLEGSFPTLEVDAAEVVSAGTLRVEILAADQASSALLLEAGSLKVLIPDGIDPALIRDLNPQRLNGLTAVVLAPDDIVLVPPSWWEKLNPQFIFWQDLSIPPESGWVSVQGSTSLELVSNGESYSFFAR